MADSTHSRSILLGTKARKKKNRILIHRKSDQFKDFVKLLHESHARVNSKAPSAEPETKVLVSA